MVRAVVSEPLEVSAGLGCHRAVGSPQKATSVERRLEFLGARETQLHAALAEAVTGASRPRELDAELRALLAERDQLEEQWLAAAEVAEG